MLTLLSQFRKNLSKKPQTGFTIVELLIVIAIIGILATIILVVYTGAQQRAQNAVLLDAARVYKNAIISYKVETGSYPDVLAMSGGFGAGCLGVDYADLNNDSTPDCGIINTAVEGREIDALNEALSPYVGKQIAIKVGSIQLLQNYAWRGMVLGHRTNVTLDGQPQTHYIFFHLNGTDANCNDKVMVPIAGSSYRLSNSNEKSSYQVLGTSACLIPLPME